VNVKERLEGRWTPRYGGLGVRSPVVTSGPAPIAHVFFFFSTFSNQKKKKKSQEKKRRWVRVRFKARAVG